MVSWSIFDFFRFSGVTNDRIAVADGPPPIRASATLDQSCRTNQMQEKPATTRLTGAAARDKIYNDLIPDLRAALEENFDWALCSRGVHKNEESRDIEIYDRIAAIAHISALVEKEKRRPVEYIHRLIAAHCEKLADDARGEASRVVGTTEQDHATEISRRSTPREVSKPYLSTDQAEGIAKADKIQDICVKARNDALGALHCRTVVASDEQTEPTDGEWLLSVAESSRDEAIRARNRAVLDDVSSSKAIKNMLEKWGHVPGLEMALQAVMRQVKDDPVLFGPCPLWEDVNTSGYPLAYRRLANAATSSISREEKEKMGEFAASALHLLARIYDRTAFLVKHNENEQLEKFRKAGGR